MVIFLPFVKAISKKFDSPVSILVKESSKADQYLNNTNYIKEIIILKRSNRLKVLSNIAYCQWSLEEIELGLPWKHLLNLVS